MKRLMQWLILSCEKAAQLIEKRSVFGLSAKERVQLTLHTSMCDACKAWEKQSKQLDKILEERLSQSSVDKVTYTRLSPEEKQALLDKMDLK